MGMIFTHGIADDTRTFTVWSVITDSQFIHIIECTSLNRFKPISDIRQSTGNNDTHCIIDKRFLHGVRIFCFNNLLFHLLPHV